MGSSAALTSNERMTFPELSPEAQDAIVNVIMGEPVPPLPQKVRDEIQAWAESDDGRLGVRVDGVSI